MAFALDESREANRSCNACLDCARYDPIPTKPLSRSLALVLLGCVLRGAPDALAQSRTSAAYTIVPEVISSAGGTATSASYRQSSTVGGVTGVSQGASDTARQGFAAQLYEITALEITAAQSTLNETASLALQGSRSPPLPPPTAAANAPSPTPLQPAARSFTAWRS